MPVAPFMKKISTLFKPLGASAGAKQKSLLHVTDLPGWLELLARRENLPGQYVTHFQPDPLSDGQSLHGREEELASLNLVLDRWEAGRACSVAMIGPEGSGKTSLLNSFAAMTAARHPTLMVPLPRRVACVKELLDIFAESFGVEKPFDSVQEVTAFILSRPRQIFILEAGHNLTLRLTGCRQALEAFFHVLIETRKHWLWIVSFRRYPWERLAMTSGIQQFFTHQVNALYHDRQQIREILEMRHNRTGLGLEFLAEEDTAGGGQDELADTFFKALFEATGGNVSAALYYWLLSLEQEETGKTIRIRPLGNVDADYLRSLDRSYHFTLAEIVWHGGLSCEEYQQLFLLSREAARLKLEYLAQLSLLETDGVGADGFPQRYRLNPIYFKQVVTLLESLHLLY